MLSELKELFAVWMAATAAAIEAIAIRIVRPRRILLVEGESDHFTARLISGRGAMLPPVSFRLLNGRVEPALPQQWQAAFGGSRIDILMRSDQMLFQTVDFPRAAADFLEGMVRAQIDRLTPWSAADVAFGVTEPEPFGSDRIALTVVATSQARIQPLLTFAAGVGAIAVVGFVEGGDSGCATGPIRIFQRSLGSAVTGAIDVSVLLRRALLATSMAAAASLMITTYFASSLEAEQKDLLRLLSQRRAALRIDREGGSAERLLAQRKQTSPSTVMVLEAMSQVLPDSTHVRELRIEADKVQVVGLTRDAPSLIKLIEQSPQFSRATFFAPTTSGQNEPGERFHIEAHITPYFGSGS